MGSGLRRWNKLQGWMFLMERGWRGWRGLRGITRIFLTIVKWQTWDVKRVAHIVSRFTSHVSQL